MHELELTFRLLMAATLGGLIGLDREIRDHDAGLRTHMLTALAAALFTIVAIEFLTEIESRAGNTRADPIRAIEAIAGSAAFLAAGTIIQSRNRVRGLTTGVAMWLAAAVGLACGAGYFIFAAAAVVLALLILTAVKRVEQRALRRKRAETAQDKQESP